MGKLAGPVAQQARAGEVRVSSSLLSGAGGEEDAGGGWSQGWGNTGGSVSRGLKRGIF